jgi:hypothetical protein
MLLLWLLLFGAFMARLAPETPVGRVLHRWLVDAPARFCNRVSLPRLVFAAVLVLALYSIGMAFTSEIALLAAIDVATYAEIVAALWLAATRVRIKVMAGQAWSGASSVARRIAARAVHVRAPRQRKPRRPTPSDDGEGWGALAFA